MRFVMNLTKALGAKALRFVMPFQKAGPYIGPRGGKWADPAHTISWDPEEKRKGKRVKQEQVKTRRNWIDHNPKMPKSTAKKYRLPDKYVHGTKGGYQPAREAMHNRIVDDFVRGKKPPPEGKQKIAIVMMGGPASGKTSLVRGILGERNDDFVNVNPDDVKELLPEWKIGLESSAKDTAFVLHDESSDVAKRVYNEAIDKGLNLIVDGTGKDSSKHVEKIRQLQKEGYHVTILMPDVDVEEAVLRSANRAEKTGRFVPNDIIRGAHQKIPGNFETIAREADSFGLFDTRSGMRPPQLKWSGGKGEEDRVHDSRFVAKFKTRAKRLRQRKVEKGLHMTDDLKKAKNKKYPPALTIDEIASSIKNADQDTMHPDAKKPKTFDRETGVEWPVEDVAAE